MTAHAWLWDTFSTVNPASTTLFVTTSFADIGPVIFWACALIFALYSLVISYHWLRYGARSSITVPTLVIYGIGAAALLAFAGSGLI